MTEYLVEASSTSVMNSINVAQGDGIRKTQFRCSTLSVQNTETKKLQKVTSEPNKDHFQIIEIRPNADPKLVEAVISNGTDQGTVKVAKRD
jgi:hypothetical protein